MFNWKSSAFVSNLILRVSLGLTMILIGIAQYRDFAPFVANVTDGLGFLSAFGTVWSYLLPALLVFGGGMLAVGRYTLVTAWVGGVAIGSIPLGLILKTVMTGLPLPDMLNAIYPMLIWFIAFYLAVNQFPDQVPMEVEEK